MIARRTAALLAATVLAAALSACAPTASPTPSPTATGFASEEEAFAAAEATYRAYVDALNDVDLSDPATFEPVYAHLSGEALDGSKKELTSLHARSLEKSGATKVESLDAISVDLESSTVTLNVCLDVSDVDVVDSSGASVVPADRNDFQLLEVSFIPRQLPSKPLVVSRSSAVGGQPCG